MLTQPLPEEWKGDEQLLNADGSTCGSFFEASNAEFLSDINKGIAPMELMDGNAPVEINLVDKKDRILFVMVRGCCVVMDGRECATDCELLVLIFCPLDIP